MYTIIVVPPQLDGTGEQLKIGPGERLAFGRATAGNDLVISHDGVSRVAGEITAHRAYWTLTNHSAHQTYVVENPEGAGEHVKIAPGRQDAPIPFEFSRVVLPAAGDLLSFDVWAPCHGFRARAADPGTPGAITAPAFALDRTKRYFAVLAALCEPRLRGAPHAPPPTVDEVVERLCPFWPAANRSSVAWNIDYLAVKLRLRPGPDTAMPGPRLNGKKQSLVSLALRFDLVREEDLLMLDAAVAGELEVPVPGKLDVPVAGKVRS
ncbi:FHA domain-containing protein [Streptomyces sp. ID05-47C]|uniref:FHA domain-containing protein n=1 Tax=Streptomyces sp. ID05-47C TaxID=3028665 RepID=UPI0029B4159E|nr:FHA domain-containing protein [Streptomyces sp. ID05-47C]MDX3574344.1 FHA domain-containing protein [Streptomyces sp. ID05-47C]